ncbi:MAG: hypothetical protein M3R04_01415 [bacterium]|nr:hypothetical protein [bacterium]
MSRIQMFLLIVALAVGCSSPGIFAPSIGSFSGTFDADAVPIGDLSFTAHSQGLAGTGMLVDGDLQIPVAISGNLNGQQITGIVSNSNLGTGRFSGSFSGAGAASGTFSFDVITGSELSGTWSASTD